MNSRFVLILWVSIAWHVLGTAQVLNAKKRHLGAVPGSVKSYASGQIESYVLVKNQLIQGVLAKRGSVVQFHPAGDLKNATLAEDQTLAGYHLRAHTQVELYVRRALYSGTLAQTKSIYGLRLPAASVINLEKKGALLRAIVPPQHKIFGLTLAGDLKQRQIHFFRRDRTLCVTTSAAQRLGEILIPTGSQVYFRYGGQLRSVVFSGTILLGKTTFCKELRFYKNLRLEQGWLPHDQSIHGLRFHHPNHPVRFFANGKPKHGQIANNQTFRGLRLRDHSQVGLHENGNLAQAELQHAQAIAGITFSGKVTFYPGGQIKDGVLSRPQQIQDLTLFGQIEFFVNGQPKRAFLKTAAEIQSVPCQAQHPIEFHTNQKLRTARLSRSLRLQEFTLKSDSLIQLHPNGALAYGRLDKPKRLGPLLIPDGFAVRLTNRGELAIPETKRPWSISQLVLPSKTRLFTDSKGSLDAAQPAKPITVFSIPVSHHGFVLFDDTERPHGIVLAETQTVVGNRFAAGTKLFFDLQGQLTSAILPHNHKIRGISFSYADPIVFHASGRPKKGTLAADWGAYQRNQSIHLYENGQPVREPLDQDEVQGPLQLKAGDRITSHYPEGPIKTVIPNAKRSIGGLPCKPGLAVWFYPTGKLKRCYLDNETEAQGLLIRDEVELFESGRLARTFLAFAQRIAHIEFSPDEIVFHPNGSVHVGRLATKQEIEGRLVEELSKVVFDQRGRLLRVEPFILPY